MSGHTAGPWIYAENGTIYADGYKKTIVNINGPGASAEDEANARLIAASPMLLEALRGLLAITDRYTGVGLQEIDAARAAIAAAEEVKP